jgi:hypothetical protein
VNAQPAGMNGNFEDWNSAHIIHVKNWQSIGDSVQLSSDANSGNYAIELQVENKNGTVFADNVTSGKYGPGGPTGGNPYFLLQDSLIGFYKLNSMGGDSGYISATFSKQDTLIGTAYVPLPPASSYTRFAVPINLSETPDTIRVDISAAFLSATTANAGSVLLVDDLHLFSESLSTKVQKDPLRGQIGIYPNPVSNSFRITGNTGSDESALLSIYSDKGSLIYRQDVRSKGLLGTTVNLSEFPRGIYLMKLEQAGKVFSQKIILQ